MRHHGLKMLACFALAVCCSPMAEAQLSDDIANWADGPPGFLLTKKERKEWKKVTNNAAAERFIELFWARRNPEPTNSFNAFKADFEARVRFADENFGYGDRRGSLSDRGRVLILMGRPSGRDLREPMQAQDRNLPATSDQETAVGRIDVWVYDADELSKRFKIRGPRAVFFFYEDRPGSNNFVLDRENRQSMSAVGALSRAPEIYLVHPELDEVPTPVSFAGAAPASAAHLAWLDGDVAPFDDVAILISELGVTDSVSRPLWVHLELPPDAPLLDLIAGRVSSADGEVMSTFETVPEAIDGQYGKAYHLSFPLAEGSYTIDLVGAAGEEPQVTANLEAAVTEIPDAGTWMSPLWMGIAATPNREAKLGDPFTIGGWHLTLISGPELTRASEITYFGFIVRPVVNEKGEVDVEARVELTRDGTQLARPLIMPLGSSHIVGDLYMYGNSIRLSGLPEAGAYDFHFTITEKGSGTSVKRDLSIEVTE